MPAVEARRVLYDADAVAMGFGGDEGGGRREYRNRACGTARAAPVPSRRRNVPGDKLDWIGIPDKLR